LRGPDIEESRGGTEIATFISSVVEEPERSARFGCFTCGGAADAFAPYVNPKCKSGRKFTGFLAWLIGKGRIEEPPPHRTRA